MKAAFTQCHISPLVAKILVENLSYMKHAFTVPSVVSNITKQREKQKKVILENVIFIYTSKEES